MKLHSSRRAFLAVTSASAITNPTAQSQPATNSPRSHPIINQGLIDCQSHLFFPEVIQVMRARKVEPLVIDQEGIPILKMGSWLRKIPAPYTSVEAKLATMDAHGIQLTLLSSNDPGPEWFGSDGPAISQLIHDSLAKVIAAHPARFRGLCTLPMQNPQAASDELDRCIGRLGFVGILLYTNLAGSWCDEPQFHWLFQQAEQLDIPILLHPAKPMTTEQVKGYELTSTLGNMFENTIALARIIASGLLDRHPKLKLVCPHLGGALPYICGRMDHQLHVLKRGPQNLERKPSEYLRSIYMDIASPLTEAMRFAIDFFGVDKLLFSSDHPWVQPTEILEPFRNLDLSADDQQRILYRNAQVLFRLENAKP
jgi:predicted TIM-barrel fold metal-dependent hydrolase